MCSEKKGQQTSVIGVRDDVQWMWNKQALDCEEDEEEEIDDEGSNSDSLVLARSRSQCVAFGSSAAFFPSVWCLTFWLFTRLNPNVRGDLLSRGVSHFSVELSALWEATASPRHEHKRVDEKFFSTAHGWWWTHLDREPHNR
jgi:hypothetical protein